MTAMEPFGKGRSGFARFVAANQRRLFHFVLKQVGNRADAEELTQEAFLQAFRSAASFRGECEPATWLFGIAINVVRTHVRRAPERRHDVVSDEILASLPAEGASPLAELEVRRRMLGLDAALARLPAEWREVLVCVVMEGFSYEQAASILGAPVGTVRSRLSRARERLKMELAAEGPT